MEKRTLLVMALFTAVLIGSGRARGTDGDNSATRGNTQVNQGRDTTVTLPGGATMEFVWIEPGTFIMGSPETEERRYVQKGPRHEVTISNDL